MHYSWPHRTLCEVLREMRDVLKKNRLLVKLNIPLLRSLVDEAQTYANRMEAGLGYKSDLKDLHDERSKLRAKLATLKQKAKKAGLKENDEF